MACGRCRAPWPEPCKVSVGMALTCLAKSAELAHIAILDFALLSVPFRAAILCEDRADMREG